jgi:hypothetical protein
MSQSDQPVQSSPTNGFSRIAERERRTDEALEAAAVTAVFVREIDARAEQGVAHLASIDASLRELLALTKANRK